jgi:hypothetical protein
MKVACVFRLRDQRGEAMETRECVIAIIWLNQKVEVNKMGPKDEYD